MELARVAEARLTAIQDLAEKPLVNLDNAEKVSIALRDSVNVEEKYEEKILKENTSLTGIRCTEEDAGWVDCEEQGSFVSLKCKLD